jgi:hypothetical protein
VSSRRGCCSRINATTLARGRRRTRAAAIEGKLIDDLMAWASLSTKNLFSVSRMISAMPHWSGNITTGSSMAIASSTAVPPVSKKAGCLR